MTIGCFTAPQASTTAFFFCVLDQYFVALTKEAGHNFRVVGKDVFVHQWYVLLFSKLPAHTCGVRHSISHVMQRVFGGGAGGGGDTSPTVGFHKIASTPKHNALMGRAIRRLKTGLRLALGDMCSSAPSARHGHYHSCGLGHP